MSDDAIEIVNRDVPFQGFFRIVRYQLRHRLYRGGWSGTFEREVFERGTAAALLPYDPDRDEVVLVEQFRLPAHLAGYPAWQLEVVAGIIDKSGESDAAVARREAREEAGLEIIGELVPIHRFMPSPGGSSEVVTLFCGRIDSRGAGGLHGLADEHEDIKVVVKSYRDAMRLVRDGAIVSGVALIALHWLAANRRRLREMWRGDGAADAVVRPSTSSG